MGALTSLEEVVKAERASLSRRRQAAGVSPEEEPVGISLSGGGLRSAFFSLGVLQALQRRQILKHIDYVSSVQGGGLLACAWLRAASADGSPPPPAGTTPKVEESSERPPPSLHTLHPAVQRNWAEPYLQQSPETRWSIASQSLFGTLLLNVFTASTLIAVCAGIAVLWRGLDYVFADDPVVQWAGLIWIPYLPFVFAVIAWFVTWWVIYFRQGARGSPGRFSRIWFRLVTVCFAVGTAVFLGSAQLKVGMGLWLMPALVIVAGLLPLLSPRRLLEAGLRPRHVWEQRVFSFATTCLLVGLPLFLIATFARENISGYAGRPDRPLVAGDISDWSGFTTLLLSEPAEGDATLPRLRPARLRMQTALHTAIPASLRARALEWRRLQALQQDLQRQAARARVEWPFAPHEPLAKWKQASLQRAELEHAICQQVSVEVLSNRELLAAQLERRQELASHPDWPTFPDRRLDERVELALITNLKHWPQPDIVMLNRRLWEEAFPSILLPRGEIRRETVIGPDQNVRLQWLGVAAAFSLLSGLFINLNAVSLSGTTERWLQETFLRALPPHLREIDLTSQGAPYPLFLGTVHPNREPFLLSPRFMGCESTGYYAPDRESDEPTVARALALSGTAMEPERSRHLLAQVLSIVLNLRNGMWLPNPQRKPRLSPVPLRVLLAARRPMKQRDFHYVSDGGSCDNLGLFPLLHRRCRLIIVCDATRDPEARFEDFTRVLRKARVDLGISLAGSESSSDRVAADRSVDPLRPAMRDGDPPSRPSGNVVRHYLLCRVRYPETEDTSSERHGLIVYLRASFTGDEDAVLNSFRDQHSGFPFDYWGDRTDSEEAEAWRRLGEHIADDVCRNVGELTGEQALAELEAALRNLPLTTREAAGHTGTELSEQLGEGFRRLENVFRGEPLANYRGFVRTRLIASDNSGTALPGGTRAELAVEFLPEEPPEGPYELIDIRDGADRQEVRFRVSVDSADCRFEALRKELTVPRGEPSSTLRFPFWTPASPGVYPVYVQVYQRTRRAQTVSHVIHVSGDLQAATGTAALQTSGSQKPRERLLQIPELAAAGTPEAAELLRQWALHDPAATVRRAALEALPASGLPESELRAALEELRRDASPSVRAAAKKMRLEPKRD